METAVGAVVVLGTIIRVVLDLAGIFNKSPVLDFAYGGLFVVVAVVMFAANGEFIWGILAAVVAMFSFMVAAGKLQGRTKGERSANESL